MPEHTPAQRKTLPTDTDNGLLVIISGPSGVGKTTITRAVERSFPDSVFSVSATTRPKTAADVEGVDYHFVDEPTFLRMIDQDAFLEHVELFGKRYGTPRAWVQEQLARGRLVILEIDVVGAIKVRSAIPDAFCLFVLPPDMDTLLQRLRDRKREPEEVIERRFTEARREIEQARASGVYDAFIVNDQLERAIEESVEVVRAARRARSRTP